MKVFKWIALIFVALGLIIFGIGLIVSKGDFSLMTKEFGNKEERYYKEITEVNVINTIDIYTVSDDISFVYNTTEELKIEYYDNENNHYTYLYQEGDVLLKYTYNKKNFLGIDVSNYTIKVYLPKSFTKEITVNTVSGDMKISDLSLVKCMIDTTNGSVTIRNTNIDDVYATTVSSDIRYIEGKTNKVIAKTTNGEIDLINIEVNELELHAVSSDINIENTKFNSLSIDTTSGEIEIEINDNPDNYKVIYSSTSGRAEIKGTKYDTKASRNLNWGSGSKKIDVKSVSSDLDIDFND